MWVDEAMVKNHTFRWFRPKANNEDSQCEALQLLLDNGCDLGKKNKKTSIPRRVWLHLHLHDEGFALFFLGGGRLVFFQKRFPGRYRRVTNFEQVSPQKNVCFYTCVFLNKNSVCFCRDPITKPEFMVLEPKYCYYAFRR